MHTLLAIDPGNVFSGWVHLNTATYEVLGKGKDINEDLLQWLEDGTLKPDSVCIEMIKSYGMSVGHTVFETCVWIGRFYERGRIITGTDPDLIFRQEIRLHHCKSPKANDSTVRQALVDRFAPNASNGGKGSKKEPGFFYGFAKDMWQAFALGAYKIDLDTNSTAHITGIQPNTTTD